MGDCKSLQGWSNLFRRRIANPPERLTDFKFTGTPNGIYPYALKGQKLLAQGVWISAELMLLSCFSLFVLF